MAMATPSTQTTAATMAPTYVTGRCIPCDVDATEGKVGDSSSSSTLHEQQQQQQQATAMATAAARMEKWRGKVEWKVGGGWGAERVWGLAGDFCGMKRWVPTLDRCERVAGEENTPKCVRYMEAGGKRCDGTPQRWVLEELIDWSDHHYTYTMLDSGYGLTGYLATLELLANHTDDSSVTLQWTFEVDPSTLFVSHQGFLTFFANTFERMMLSLETALNSSDQC